MTARRNVSRHRRGEAAGLYVGAAALTDASRRGAHTPRAWPPRRETHRINANDEHDDGDDDVNGGDEDIHDDDDEDDDEGNDDVDGNDGKDDDKAATMATNGPSGDDKAHE